jgi:hypothetical protein
MSTVTPIAIDATARLSELAARRAAVDAETAALQAALPPMSDTELVQRLATCTREYWMTGPNPVIGSGTTGAALGCPAVLRDEYMRRAGSRQMPPIPMPTDVAKYRHANNAYLANEWVRTHIPGTMAWSPIRIYAENAVRLYSGFGATGGESFQGRAFSAGIVALPFVAGYIGYRKTGSPGWSALIGVGSVYAAIALYFGLMFFGPARY